MKSICSLLFVFCVGVVHAQYAPQVGQPGSDAISMYSSVFTGWAAGCTVSRGVMDIADPSLGYASAGDSTLALGVADGSIVCLGDSGVATVTFASPVYNGPGPDFAIFENGFINTADSSQAFLELGFVEVSSDGVHFFRFPATSLTPVDVQLANGDYITASHINNLAGKYIGAWGTPFDLELLAGIPALDINHVTHIRVVDVIGNIGNHACHDSAGRVINDPYPTPFPTGGFDLDAVGVIHQVSNGVSLTGSGIGLSVYPNPVTDNISISLRTFVAPVLATLVSVTGVVLQRQTLLQSETILPVGHLPAGMYYLLLQDTNGNKWVEKISKR